MRSVRGQSSIEYVGVLALALAVMAAAAAAGAGAEGTWIGRSVHREFVRALCLVRSGDCWRDAEPCVISTSQTSERGHISVTIVRLGAGHSALLEQLSDGTYAVTEVFDGEGGLELSAGFGASSRGGDAVALGGEARAAVLGHAARGQTWKVRTLEEAQRLMRSLPLVDDRPEPAETFGEGGWSVSLGGTAGAAVGGGSLELSAKDVYGTRRIASNGHRVMYVRESQAFRASMSAGLAVGKDEGKGKGDGKGDDGGSAKGEGGGPELSVSASYEHAEEATYGVEVDANGRPVSLSVTTTGRFAGSRDLPGHLQPVAGLMAAPGSGPRAYELVRRLDLTDDRNADVARDFLRQVTSVRPTIGSVVDVSRALGAQLDASGTSEARVFAVDEQIKGGDVQAKLGPVAIGAGGEVATRSTRLLAAVSRGVDGQWLRRDDCVES